jgi:hypothetical protein
LEEKKNVSGLLLVVLVFTEPEGKKTRKPTVKTKKPAVRKEKMFL